MKGSQGAAAGAAVWLVAILIIRPGPFETNWARAILLLAALVLVPLGLRLAEHSATRLVQPPAALLLGAGFLMPQGPIAAALSLPYTLMAALIAAAGLMRLLYRPRSAAAMCENAGLVYLAVGAGWATLDRAGAQPLGFEPMIVLLTAIHFHYAGFVLPVVAGRLLREFGGLPARVAGLLVIVAVPAVAAGITTTQLHLGPGIECLAAWLMGTGGLLCGLLQLRLAARPGRPALVRVLWSVAGLSLIFSMVLAMTYGSRAFAPVAWLDIPWMRALHGSANALGFGLAGLCGWTLARGAR